MIPLIMVLKQENVNPVTIKNDGIEDTTSFIHSQQVEGENEAQGNSLFEDFSYTKINENLDTTRYISKYTFISQRLFCF